MIDTLTDLLIIAAIIITTAFVVGGFIALAIGDLNGRLKITETVIAIAGHLTRENTTLRAEHNMMRDRMNLAERRRREAENEATRFYAKTDIARDISDELFDRLYDGIKSGQLDVTPSDAGDTQEPVNLYDTSQADHHAPLYGTTMSGDNTAETLAEAEGSGEVDDFERDFTVPAGWQKNERSGYWHFFRENETTSACGQHVSRYPHKRNKTGNTSYHYRCKRCRNAQESGK